MNRWLNLWLQLATPVAQLVGTLLCGLLRYIMSWGLQSRRRFVLTVCRIRLDLLFDRQFRWDLVFKDLLNLLSLLIIMCCTNTASETVA